MRLTHQTVPTAVRRQQVRTMPVAMSAGFFQEETTGGEAETEGGRVSFMAVEMTVMMLFNTLSVRIPFHVEPNFGMNAASGRLELQGPEQVQQLGVGSWGEQQPKCDGGGSEGANNDPRVLQELLRL